MINEIHFTLIEARETLKTVLPDIKSMIDVMQELKNMSLNIYRHPYFSGKPQNGEQYHPLELNVLKIVKRIRAKGIHIKNMETGLIDFPAIRKNGDEVFLCWMFGEDDISFWHNIQDGFAGRQSISTM